MLTFQLTIDVKPGAHDAYLAYKSESLRHVCAARAHRWTVLVGGGEAHPHRYYQVTQVESSAALDQIMQAAPQQELVRRAQPYDHMASSPAQRDDMTVLFDDDASATSRESGRPDRCLRVRCDLAAPDVARWVEQLRRSTRHDQLAVPGARRILLQDTSDPTSLTYLAFGVALDAHVRFLAGTAKRADIDQCPVLALLPA